MAGPNYKKEFYWPEILVFSEEKVKDLFKNYNIESFIELRSSGKLQLESHSSGTFFSGCDEEIHQYASSDIKIGAANLKTK